MNKNILFTLCVIILLSLLPLFKNEYLEISDKKWFQVLFLVIMAYASNKSLYWGLLLTVLFYSFVLKNCEKSNITILDKYITYQNKIKNKKDYNKANELIGNNTCKCSVRKYALENVIKSKKLNKNDKYKSLLIYFDNFINLDKESPEYTEIMKKYYKYI